MPTTPRAARRVKARKPSLLNRAAPLLFGALLDVLSAPWGSRVARRWWRGLRERSARARMTAGAWAGGADGEARTDE